MPRHGNIMCDVTSGGERPGSTAWLAGLTRGFWTRRDVDSKQATLAAAHLQSLDLDDAQSEGWKGSMWGAAAAETEESLCCTTSLEDRAHMNWECLLFTVGGQLIRSASFKALQPRGDCRRGLSGCYSIITESVVRSSSLPLRHLTWNPWWFVAVIFRDSDLHSFVIFELVFDVSHNFVDRNIRGKNVQKEILHSNSTKK